MATTPTPLIWQNAVRVVNDDVLFGGTTIQFKDGNGRIYYIKDDNTLYSKDAEVTQGHWQDMELADEEKLDTKNIKLMSMTQPVTSLLYSLVVVHNDATGFDKIFLVKENFDDETEETVRIKGLNKEEPQINSLSRSNKTDVLVKYYIPLGNWDYVRLVCKANSAPTSITDGRGETITGNERLITNLDSLTRYYFTIFAKDSSTGRIIQSQPKDIVTGNAEVIAAFEENIITNDGVSEPTIKTARTGLWSTSFSFTQVTGG